MILSLAMQFGKDPDTIEVLFSVDDMACGIKEFPNKILHGHAGLISKHFEYASICSDTL